MISLTPKAFAVLQCLVARPGRLVTKEEIFRAVWPDTYVGDAVLKVCIGEIRKALKDRPTRPKYIETRHRRGYCLIAPLKSTEDRPFLGPAGSPAYPETDLLGRETVLAQLADWLGTALGGERQVIFLTGEPGIGKTAVAEAFLERAATAARIWVAHGQCLEQFGTGEAYLPVLEAFGRLCREPGREAFVELLGRMAPTWLAQMPALIDPAKRERLQRETLGATPERMLREMAETVEALTAQTPLLLVLEDLQWSDYSSLDLISCLARRRGPARLLILGTYRPADVTPNGHPLKAIRQELRVHRQCKEVALELLPATAVAEYLTARFPHNHLPPQLAGVIHQRTAGNPLFMINLVDYLVNQEALLKQDEKWQLTVALEDVQIGVPENVRQCIEKQLDRLNPPAQRVLEAASVLGAGFAVEAVATALEEDAVQVEEWCENLARQNQFLRRTGTWELPSGGVSAVYHFIHPLYQSVCYERLAPARRTLMHERIGRRGEALYGERAAEMASLLAFHFERARDYERAFHYLHQAAGNATRLHAHREAIGYLYRSLEIAQRLPQSGRPSLEMAALEQLGLAHRAMGDMPGAARHFESFQAAALRQGRVENVTKGLLYAASALSWIDRDPCLATVERALQLSGEIADPLLRAHTRGFGAYWHLLLRGWHDDDARAAAEAEQAARQAGDQALLRLHLGRGSFFLCLRSEYRAACRAAEEGLQRALEVGDAFDYLVCYFFRAWALLHLGEWGEMLRVVQDGMEMAEKNGHHLWTTQFLLLKAWLHQQAQDFASARALSERALTRAREARHAFSDLIAMTLLGGSFLGLGQAEAAYQCFQESRRMLESRRILMDWIVQIPLHLGLSEYWLGKKEMAKAKQEAEQACAQAALPGERTWLAAARALLAVIAQAEGNRAQSEGQLALAWAALEGFEAPLAEWRLFDVAARLALAGGREAEARALFSRSEGLLKRLRARFRPSDV